MHTHDRINWIISGYTSYGVEELNEGTFAVISTRAGDWKRHAIFNTSVEAEEEACALAQD